MPVSTNQELLIATKITLLMVGAEIKIALTYNTDIPRGLAGLNIAATRTRPKGQVGCIPMAPSHSLSWRLSMRND